MNAAMPTPFDVKLMNLTASVLFSAFAVTLLAAGLWWAVRHPVFSIAGITVQGDVAHNSALTLRANVAPRLAGNFFTVNLAAAREAFESVPWVRHAIVRREFPNRLRVQLQEHKAVALWGPEGESRLVNEFGEVFEANAGDVEADDLPRLAGPVEQAAEVLAMYRALKPVVETLDLGVENVTLTARGSWELQVDNGAVVELGRGTQQEVLARTQRFVQTLTQVTSRYGRRPDALVSADLRHGDGYAVRLRGVGTTSADTAPKK
ncbi:cell division protein FtsQ/DivIB [Caenimonas aquaedulcis]|uniref:Cell division protein FtsQ n=1 Tax=Caenimonas aquaedulcis TaxID=2793270 RepID=A0A931H7R6_9BURK|nr:cell division protein FtsQ/DivIB [Caenimonas aquaedulcis]MBG9389933.1 cell division protein FtsQ/DivIB [Caenimonas aquaedulcis]